MAEAKSISENSIPSIHFAAADALGGIGTAITMNSVGVYRSELSLHASSCRRDGFAHNVLPERRRTSPDGFDDYRRRELPRCRRRVRFTPFVFLRRGLHRETQRIAIVEKNLHRRLRSF